MLLLMFLAHAIYNIKKPQEFYIIPTSFLFVLNNVVQNESRGGLKTQKSRIKLGEKGA